MKPTPPGPLPRPQTPRHQTPRHQIPRPQIPSPQAPTPQAPRRLPPCKLLPYLRLPCLLLPYLRLRRLLPCLRLQRPLLPHLRLHYARLPFLLRPYLLLSCLALAAGIGCAPTRTTSPAFEPPGYTVDPSATPVGDLPGSETAVHEIDRPGTYRLDRSITGREGRHGILIKASDVTLDLGGHVVLGVPGSLHGIAVQGHRQNVRIARGAVKGWGHTGIFAPDVHGGVFEELNLGHNGNEGLDVGIACRVTGCAAGGNGGIGLRTDAGGIVDLCVSWHNGRQVPIARLNSNEPTSYGPNNNEPDTHKPDGNDPRRNGPNADEPITDKPDSTDPDGNGPGRNGSNANGPGDAPNSDLSRGDRPMPVENTNETDVESGGDGIVVGDAGVITRCVTYGNRTSGIRVFAGGVVQRCTARSHGRDGIRLGPFSHARDCVSTFNRGTGIVAADGANIRSCIAAQNERHGITAGSFSHLEGNHCHGNGPEAGGAGIRVTGIDNHIVGNTLALNGVGLELLDGGNVANGNMYQHNGDNSSDNVRAAPENELEGTQSIR